MHPCNITMYTYMRGRLLHAAGNPLHHDYTNENVELVTAGCCNLARHIENARKYGVPVVVAINQFACDTPAELEAMRAAAMEAGVVMATYC